MFAGIIREIGKVQELTLGTEAAILAVQSPLFAASCSEGDSIAVAGTCLTIERVENGVATFHVGSETLRRTTLGKLKKGVELNLERSLRAGESIDGHFVSGHVDAVIKILERANEGNTVRFTFALPVPLRGLIAPKGSVALDGVSLTVGEVSDATFSVYVIPYTAEKTTVANWQAGTEVNVEADLLARYVQASLKNSR